MPSPAKWFIATVLLLGTATSSSIYSASAESRVSQSAPKIRSQKFRSGETIDIPFVGVTYINRRLTSPRLLNQHIVLINLATTGLKFRVTSPAADGSTALEKTISFTRRSKAQIGINGNFFQALSSTRAKVLGLAASSGRVYSSWSNGYQGAINFSSNRTATFVTPPSGLGTTTVPLLTPYNLVSGLPVLVKNGQNVTVGVANPNEYAARSVIGLTQNQQLLLFAVDGPRSNVSTGMNQIELADLLISDFKVVHAVNLDGGGSSTLVFCRPTCAWVNIPSSTTFGIGDRSVANNLAIYVPTIISQSSPSLFGTRPPAWLQQLLPWSHKPLPWATLSSSR
uniref:Phosphodiester glycosidase domain-containing protein n=1 Tax=Cyanothece sp. (strain PCC 7425 / ATCC 29141) TaxID=395961 RepID=B8HPJ4_CYAP4